MTERDSNPAVATLVRFADSAFDGQHWHALMRNIGSLHPDDWDWAPPNGERTIREFVRHIGKCKLVFANQLFGDGALSWDDATAGVERVGDSDDGLITWLREAHAAFRDGIASCTDDQLATCPDAYWGKPTELQWSIEVLIQHDIYHAGEINHIRALHHGDDAWGNDPDAEDLA